MQSKKLIMSEKAKQLPRCCWPGEDQLMIKYHDSEWGARVYDDRELFEHLILDGMQAGLSWRTILHKRENFRAAFDKFNPEKIARYNEAKINKLMLNESIIRNRRKIESVIINAKAWIDIQENEDGFSNFLWQFVDNQTIVNHWTSYKDSPSESKESRQMSKALKNRGFKFVGPTICYAFMQAVGMVNDHAVSCFRHKQIANNSPFILDQL